MVGSCQTGTNLEEASKRAGHSAGQKSALPPATIATREEVDQCVYIHVYIYRLNYPKKKWIESNDTYHY